MYQIKCDEYILYDPRDEGLILLDPKCKLAVNTVSEGSFTILKTHPYYDKLKKLKSIVEFSQDGETIFRGRITNDSRDFYNQTDIDLEGVLAFTNDTLIPPFNFPDEFVIEEGQNVVKVLLAWVLNKHNSQVSDFQKLKLGTVTVSDPNNVIVRSSEKYVSTWEILKTRFFDSSLGGYLYARYEADGTYIDYVDSFTLTNTQTVELTENILDLTNDTDASETVTACLPLGAESGEGEEKHRLTLETITDGYLTDDIVKTGLYIYSESAVEKYGWICASVDDTTWDDVKQVNNLKSKAMAWLTGTGMMLSNTIKIKAIDLHMTDDEIQRFRPFRNVLVNSKPHGLNNTSYQLTELEVDIMNPQNMTITIGDTKQTLTDMTDESTSDLIQRVENVGQLVDTVQSSVGTIRNQIVTLGTTVKTTCESIVMDALKEYSETGDLGKFRETVTAQLKIMAEQIEMNFTNTTESIENVNGDLQDKFETLKKYIRFGIDGITIGADENALKLSLDNDKIKFTKNGLTVGWWDGTDFHTGNIIVEVNERAQFGDFAFIPRSDGSLMFLKVGG